MNRTQCVLSLILLFAGLAHTFDWDIVIAMDNGLQFYDVNGSLTHSEHIPSGIFYTQLIYDPVHNRILFIDLQQNILSFDIASKTIDTLLRNKKHVNVLAYDPTSELLFWSENYRNVYSISLKHGLNSTVNEKSLVLDSGVYNMAVDICGGFIYWISEHFNIMRARFDGSGRETVIETFTSGILEIDQEKQEIYWFKSGFNYDRIEYAGLNGLNTRQIQCREFGWTTTDLAVSKEHLYLRRCDMLTENCSIRKIPKNATNYVNVLDDSNIIIRTNSMIWRLAAKYNIEDITRGVDNCDRLKSLLPNNSVGNVSSDVSLLCVHGTKVNGESRCECTLDYSGETCDDSVNPTD